MLKAQYVQLSFFSPEAQNLKAESLYQAVAGSDPDMVQSNRTPTPEAPFFSVASGGTGETDTRVQVHPGRIDIAVSPKGQGSGIPLLSPLEHLKHLGSVADRISFGSARVNRASVIVQLLQVFPTMASVTDFLLEQTPLSAEFAGASDLNLQLNKRREFKSWPGREMNRIVTLNESVFQRVQLEFVAPNMAPRPVGVSEFGAGIMLDMNSAPGPEFIPSSTLPALMKELIEESIDFASSDAPFLLLR